MHTYQPLTEKFIVKPSHYVILHQIENENVSTTHIGLLDMKKSKLFLLIIRSHYHYNHTSSSVNLCIQPTDFFLVYQT